MRLIFPWAYNHPWRLFWFYVTVFVCYLFSSGNDIQYAILPGLIVGGAMIAGALITTAGINRAASIQAQSTANAAKWGRKMAEAAADTPLAKAQQRFGLEAFERLEHDKYIGLTAGQKRKMMRQALYGYDAAMRASELDLRRRISRMGFGSSGMVMEALSDMTEGKKDVASKTAAAAEAHSAAEIARKRSEDISIATGTPDAQAAALRQQGQIMSNAAMQQGNIAAAATQAKSQITGSTLYGVATYSPPAGYQPWYLQGGGGAEEGPSAQEQYWAARAQSEGLV